MIDQERIEYFKNEIARLSNQVVSLLDERDGLKAHVELLREAMENLMAFQVKHLDVWYNLPFDRCRALLKATPAQCLQEIKAQAVIDAINAHKNNLLTFDSNTAIRVTDLIQYANQLRQQAKGAL